MNRGTRAALVAAAGGALVGIPALARAQQQPPMFVAVDATVNGGHWDANGDPQSSALAISTHDTVGFSYPAGMSRHSVSFTSAVEPTCTGVPAPANWGPAWTATCRFDQPGTYAFFCPVHPRMTGTVTVTDPPPSPTPTYGATPTPTPTPTPTAPAATPTPAPMAQSDLTVRLAARQRGTHVRGSVQVQTAPSRLDVSARAALSRGKAVRVGRWLKRSAPAGKVTFSVPVNARARRALRQRHRLRITLRIALTPPAGRTLNRTAKTTLRSG